MYYIRAHHRVPIEHYKTVCAAVLYEWELVQHISKSDSMVNNENTHLESVACNYLQNQSNLDDI